MIQLNDFPGSGARSAPMHPRHPRMRDSGVTGCINVGHVERRRHIIFRIIIRRNFGG